MLLLLKDADSGLHRRAAMEYSHTDTCNVTRIMAILVPGKPLDSRQIQSGTPCFSFAARAAGDADLRQSRTLASGLLGSVGPPHKIRHTWPASCRNRFSARPTLWAGLALAKYSTEG